MFEKVNPSHPDKVADRIAGAIVDLAYKKDNNPKIAVEVLLGHGNCYIIAESSVIINEEEVNNIVHRICGNAVDKYGLEYVLVPQDPELAKNQEEKLRCGDNGIFRGVPYSNEEQHLITLAKAIYKQFPSDGKYLVDTEESKIVICQSNMNAENKAELEKLLKEKFKDVKVNPLGEWTGGSNVDCGATNRKIGSDMGRGATGGGLHGKDLSKADVSLNIYCYLKAKETGKPVELTCAIGDEMVDGKEYSEIVEIARNYINSVGGFEKFAEWGLI